MCYNKRSFYGGNKLILTRPSPYIVERGYGAVTGNISPEEEAMAKTKDKVIIFDTTLRDGEQAAGGTLNIQEKLEIARQLERLGVDVIEAGFPISSPGDFEAVRLIAREVRKPDNLRPGPRPPRRYRPRLGGSQGGGAPPHPCLSLVLGYTPRSTSSRRAARRSWRPPREMVARAKKYTDDIEFSPMDASRTEPEYIYQILKAVIDAGATTVNIPDTVGYAIPDEFGKLIEGIFKNVPNIDKAVVSVHCHNDLGLAVANSLEAVRRGARQVECTINGIGERAGNASLEEIVMAIKTRQDFFNLTTQINTNQIYKSQPTGQRADRLCRPAQ